MLLTWLQSTLSTLILSRVLGCTHSYEVWECIHDYFHKQTIATASQLRTQLCAMTLAGNSIREFLSQIRAISDSLASVGSRIMLQEHIDSILEGLSPDYHPIIAIIESKFEPQPIDQVEAFLLAHESHFNKFKQSSSGSPSIAQVSNKQDPESFSNFRGGSSHEGSYSGGFNHNGGRQGGASSGAGGSSGRGHGAGHYANFQCQVCYKYGYTAFICHFHFDGNYQPNSSLVLHFLFLISKIKIIL